MYYKSVNRGLNFTRLGRYLIGLTLLIGVLAVVTGINGMFLFLGISLGLLAVSGLISEKNLKICDLQGAQAELLLQADRPISIPIILNNLSQHDDLFGIELLLCSDRPSVAWWRAKFQAVSDKKLLHLGRNQQQRQTLTCPGLNRGHYKMLHLIVQTRFPFGIFLKYKFVTIATNLYIYPAPKDALLSIWQPILTQLRVASAGLEDFVGHEPYQVGTPLKNLDWRKNAGRERFQWVAKSFNQSHPGRDIDLILERRHINTLSPIEWERLLDMLSTGIDLLCRARLSLNLRVDNQLISKGPEACYRWLASANPTNLPPTGVLSNNRNDAVQISVSPYQVRMIQ